MYHGKIKIWTECTNKYQQCFTIQNTFRTLDRDFLQQLGGVENSSRMNILEIDEKYDLNETHVICHSPYHDFEKLTSTLHKNKINSVFSAQRYNQLMLRLMNLGYL